MHATFNLEKLLRKDIAFCFNVHAATISRWCKTGGMPRNEDGTFSLQLVIAWSIARAEMVPHENEPEEAKRWLTAFRRERALLAKIERKKVEGSLISWDDIQTEWAKRVSVVTSGLETFADRLPPLLEGKKRELMREIIRDEVWQLRNDYATKGRYCPEQADQGSGDGKK